MARLWTIILSLFLITSLSEVNAKNPPPGTGTSDIPANILIMLDNSGSMSARLAGAVQIHYPVDVNVDSNGNIYVLEYWNNRIKKFDSSGNYLKAFGGPGSNCSQWRSARQFDIKGNIIYISDTNNYRFVMLDLEGNCVRTQLVSHLRQSPVAMAVGGGWAWASGPDRIASHYSSSMYQNPGGNVYNNEGAGSSFIWGMSWNNGGSRIAYANYSKNQVRIAYRSGHQLVAQNSPYASNRVRNCNANRPSDTAWDSSGNVYYTSVSQHAVYKINPDTCSESKLVGSWSTSSGFRYPYGIEIDSSDNIYVTDYYNFSVRKYNTSGTETLSVGGSRTRLEAAKKVIKKIVSNTDLTSGANFGLMEWGSSFSSRTRIRVKISNNGAKEIFRDVDGIYASGGTNLNNALNRAREYFRSGQVANWNKTCSQNFLIVISDGYWSSHSSVLTIANILNKTDNIQTFAVGFALGGASNNYQTLAEKGGTKAPLYAENETDLLAKLTDAIKQAISGRLTFTTPAVMSDVTRGNFIYQATFEYEKNKQWKGSLKKYKLNSNGTFGAEQWDAADKLNDMNASTRNIWTSGISATGINNFTTSNRDILKPLMFPSQSPTDTQVDNLINFVRGVDTYDQDSDNNTTESIHKLADIYHSELIVVAAPEASNSNTGNSNHDKTDSYYRNQNNYNNFKNGASCGGPCRDRTEVVIAGSNNGILHAFRTSDGKELWGYIPPVLLGNLERIPSSTANVTNAIYGVDGSPTVKDIYFDDTPHDNTDNPRWRTVLIGGLGAGGNAIYSIDITDINNPKHLFAIQNDPSNREISHWDSSGAKNIYSYGSGSGSIPKNLNYSKLGETWSAPRIIRIKVNNKDKWVAVFGAGYNAAVNPDIGSAVYVLDIENEGKLIKDIDIEDQVNVMHNYVFGIPNGNTKTEFSMSQYGLSSYNVNCCKIRVSGAGDIKYTVTGTLNGDTMSNIKLNFETAPSNVIITASKVNKTDIINSLPADLSVVTANGTTKANYDGALIYASDLEGKITKINLTGNFNLNSDNILTNVSSTTLFNAQSTSENGRYIYTRPEVTINNDNNLWLYFGTGNTQKLHEQSNKIKNRLYGIKDVNFPQYTNISTPGDVSNCKTSPNCPQSNDLGWYIDLQNYQKLTAEPTVDKDRVYFPIYEPTTGANACNTGNAILRAFDTKCGNSLLNVNMGTGVLSKVVKQDDNLYLGISGEANKNISGFTTKDNLITGKSKAKSTSGAVQIESWKENY